MTRPATSSTAIARRPDATPSGSRSGRPAERVATSAAISDATATAGPPSAARQRIDPEGSPGRPKAPPRRSVPLSRESMPIAPCGGRYPVVKHGHARAPRVGHVPSETRYARNDDVTLAWMAAGEGAAGPRVHSRVRLARRALLGGARARRVLRAAEPLRARDRHGPPRVRPVRSARPGPDARRRGARRPRRPRRRRQRARRALRLHDGRRRRGARRDGSRPSASRRSCSTPRWSRCSPTTRSSGPTRPSSPTRPGSAWPSSGARGRTSSIVAPVAHRRRAACAAWLARLERLSASPGEVRAMAQTFGANDIRADLPELNVPTLILHRAGDRMIDVRHSRYIAERVPGRALRRARGHRQPAELGRRRAPCWGRSRSSSPAGARAASSARC